MNKHAEMKVTYIDPDQRALYVAELPDGGYGAWTQKGKDAPRKLVSKGYIKPEGYDTFENAQAALGLYVSNKRSDSAWGSWDIFVNGKRVEWDEYYAMNRGELAAPAALLPDAQVTLANIEYRIATHIQGAYENFLEVGRCLNEAKEAGLVPHGQWEEWVRRNTGMGERQAQKLMQAARNVLPGSAMERLPISKIQALLALPEPEREPMAEQAAGENMSLRKLQAAVKAKLEAEEKAKSLEKQLATTKRDAQAYLFSKQGLEQEQQRLRDQLNFRNHDIERLKKELEEANSKKGEGISAEAQAEIDRLKAELVDAEQFSERQAELRQQAQLEMLELREQAARGGAQGAPEGLTAFELAAAVRTFLGTAGVLPHMGAVFAGATSTERQAYTQYVEMIETWVTGARQALTSTYVDEWSDEQCLAN